jgi:hypothetical protein
MADIQAGFRPNNDARTGAVNRRWLFLLLGLAVVPFLIRTIHRDSERRGGMAQEAYAQLVKSIHEHENIEVKDLTFRLDEGVNDYRGEQYSGTFTRPGGELVPVKAWVKWYSSAKGQGYLLNWALEKPANAPAPPGPATHLAP